MGAEVGEGHGASGGARAAVGAFERVLMRRHRLELRGLALRLEAVVRDLEALDEQQQQRLVQHQAAAADKDSLSPGEPMALALAALQARVPGFFGERVRDSTTATTAA